MSDSQQWRDREPRHRRCGLCGTQWPTERLELVERLIRSEHARAIAERKVRALERPNDPDHGLTALAVRVEELEQIIERQNQTIAARRRKSA